MCEEKAYQHERDRIFCGEELKYCPKKVIMNLLFQELSDVLLCKAMLLTKNISHLLRAYYTSIFPKKIKES